MRFGRRLLVAGVAAGLAALAVSGIIEDAFSRHGLHFRSPFGLR
jgi:hypothetical protein